MPRPNWKARLAKLKASLPEIDRRGDDAGLRLAILETWLAMANAPGPLLTQYNGLSEALVQASSETIDIRSGEELFGLPSPSGPSDLEHLLVLAGFLRALERYFWDTIEERFIPADVNKDWSIAHPEGKFLIVPVPHRPWKEPEVPAKDFRPFSQRGVVFVRIFPATVDGAQVRLALPDLPKRKTSEMPFGAVLFRGVKFSKTVSGGAFLINGVSGSEMASDATSALKSAHEENCIAVVFPELTVDDDLLAGIIDDLIEKPWADGAGLQMPPSLVVAGSWHRPVSGGNGNLAPILDGNGNQLVVHQKLFPAMEGGIPEGIVPGDVLHLLIIPEGIVAFGICLDFCQRYFESLYGTIDADFVLVPSCGNDATMNGHISVAEELHIRRRTRSFVVQQAHPQAAPVLGYVLPPNGGAKPVPLNTLLESSTWSLFKASEFV